MLPRSRGEHHSFCQLEERQESLWELFLRKLREKYGSGLTIGSLLFDPSLATHGATMDDCERDDIMADIDVLLLVKLPERTAYQEVEFFQQMEEQGWQLVEDGNALYAAYPGSIGDREVVAQSERDLRQAAEYSGVKSWDAVCLLKELSGESDRLAIIGQMSKTG